MLYDRIKNENKITEEKLYIESKNVIKTDEYRFRLFVKCLLKRVFPRHAARRKMDKIERSERERAEKTQITAFLSYFPCWFIQTELQNTEAFVCVIERESEGRKSSKPQNS